MKSQFPYQIVTFLGQQPERNEPVYGGENGWYPQVALKRRFTLRETTEQKFIDDLGKFFGGIGKLAISTGELIKPERMPVRVVDIVNQDELKDLHMRILEQFDHHIVSKFPERESENYYPHITAEYGGQFVIPYERFTNQTFDVSNIWLLKDVDGGDSVAYALVYRHDLHI